jgi:hypothetical protein
MTRTILAAALLLTTPFVFAQGEAPAPTQDPQAAYDALARDFGKAMSDWMELRQQLIQKAQEEGSRPPPEALRPPTKDYIERAQALAKQFAGKEAAVPFLTFVIKNASSERSAVRQAVGMLYAEHAAQKAIGEALPHLSNAMRFGAREPVFQLLDEVIAQNPDAACKARGHLTRGAIRLETARTEEDRKQAEADLRTVAKVTQDEDLLAEAKEALFEIEHLSIGATAPDIDGVDVDGVAFKLSDYRGKVVLLDFWGFW